VTRLDSDPENALLPPKTRCRRPSRAEMRRGNNPLSDFETVSAAIFRTKGAKIFFKWGKFRACLFSLQTGCSFWQPNPKPDEGMKE
jgi:hypothetical protein